MHTLLNQSNGHNGIPGGYKVVGERKTDTYKKEISYGHILGGSVVIRRK